MLATRSGGPNGSPTKRPRPFSCRRFDAPSGVRVAVGGELDFTTVPQVDRALHLAWATSDVLVLDLRELTYIDASGARLVLEATRRIRRAGGQLITVRGPTELDCWLALFSIDQTVDLVDQPPDPAGPENANAAPTGRKPAHVTGEAPFG